MSKSNRRTFLKNVGQGTLVAGLGLGLPGKALASGLGAEKTKKEDTANKDSSWPYPLHYGKETEVEFDVVVVGGGVSGCWAAIGAARKGLKVALVDKGNPIRSGCVGSGVDHWQDAATNPASKVDPDELAQEIVDSRKGYINGIARTIKCHESYDRLLEMEKMGMKVRDDDDEFKGAEFRDEKTKLLFAYNYGDKVTLRTWATGLKPALTRECKRLGVKIFDRVMGTSLLTEKGRQGGRVVGVTGVNVRTGEFFIFKSKATILTSARATRVWQFVDTVGTASHRPPCNSGDGMAMAWKAGAEFTLLEDSQSGLGLNPGVGMLVPQSDASWYAMTIVDSNGKELPWFDAKGNPLTTVSQRYYPAPGQKRFIAGGAVHPLPAYNGARPLGGKQLEDEVKKGNYVLPLYADLPSMPEHERKVIFGLMIGQEGMTWIGYRNMCKAGFDRDKDMFQLYQDPYRTANVRSTTLQGGGLVVDWNLRTNLEGLYAAGEQAFGTWGCAGSSTTGHWAGSKAADYAMKTTQAPIERSQVDAEKKRVLAPAERISWKVLENGVAKVMQDYCGDVRHEEKLKLGNQLLASYNESEVKTLRATTPHELMRSLEAINIVTIGQMIMNASMARKSSNSFLDFHRTDYPSVDPPEWEKLVTLKLDQDQVVVGELPLNYGGPLAENYAKHSERKG
jgi:succinate dehydrogenase/fumarate reductase flavoprotein subunit